jgi:hypothetical protein
MTSKLLYVVVMKTESEFVDVNLILLENVVINLHSKEIILILKRVNLLKTFIET